MTVGWRPIVALAAAAGCAVTLGVTPAFAADSSAGKCSAGGYQADATVKYRRVDPDLYVGSVGLNIDKDAGPRNRVRLVVRADGRTVFNYTSQDSVTAGPYLLDYSDHPIRVPQAGAAGEIQVLVTVQFDTSRSDATRDDPSRDDPSRDDPSRDDSNRDDSNKDDAKPHCTATVTL